ncbi:hypothetical protein [Streptomyces sp. NPDC050263]|uniref:hypothetical protein n=1 Tax=Streptomyces sp. NPDC050263 TaxID=3155037 RepID=UPI003448B759
MTNDPAPSTPQRPKPVLSVCQLDTIVIGGVIGVGLFVGSGTAISAAGPTMLLACIGIGAVIFLIKRMPQESATCSPAPGGRRAGPLPVRLAGPGRRMILRPAGPPSQDQPQPGHPHRPQPRRTTRKCFHRMENTHARPGPTIRKSALSRQQRRLFVTGFHAAADSSRTDQPGPAVPDRSGCSPFRPAKEVTS